MDDFMVYGLFGFLLLAVIAFVFQTAVRRKAQDGSDISSKKTQPKASFLTRKRQTVTLCEKESMSHDVRRFRFALPSSAMVLGLPMGKHVKVFAPNSTGVVEGEWNGRPDPETGRAEVERKYTPTSSNEDYGYFDLMLKVYKRGVKERFPDGGKMSQYLDSLRIGDSVDVQGPVGLHTYVGMGLFKCGRKQHQCRRLGMIAGGTGITPMLQIIRCVLRTPRDKTELFLLFANQTEADIFLRDELETLQRAHPQRLHLWYTVDHPPQPWAFSSGFIDADMINKSLPPPDDDTLVLMCGPPPMIKFACRPNLEKLGYATEQCIEF